MSSLWQVRKFYDSWEDCGLQGSTSVPVLCVAATDLNGDGGQEILAGCQDGSVYVLDTRGR